VKLTRCFPQQVVAEADAFPGVWSRFNEFLALHGVFDDPMSYAFLTCGDWDLRTMLPNQLAYESRTNPDIPASPAVAPFGRCINVKMSFRKHYDQKNRGMADMLEQLNIPLEGKHHSGIDDCRNIARIVQRMQRDGWRPGEPDFRVYQSCSS
jgi:inhibitor of KinA sporulation pathway (predicted exonuclease)